jgi:ribonuclease PH
MKSGIFSRKHNRPYNQIRDVVITYNSFGYAPGNVLLELGNTKVLCAASLQMGVPPFLKGKKQGWLTAEYAMLPTSTLQRSMREVCATKRSGRSVEIGRLIGRSLRSIVALERLGERTIVIDCDVLQADGSTRTACISGAYLALKAALDHWKATGLLSGVDASTVLREEIAAVSVGFQDGKCLLDIDYEEDVAIDADYNFVFTRTGRVIEIQGGAERSSISWEDFLQARSYAMQGCSQLFSYYDSSIPLKGFSTFASLAALSKEQ